MEEKLIQLKEKVKRKEANEFLTDKNKPITKLTETFKKLSTNRRKYYFHFTKIKRQPSGCLFVIDRLVRID